MVMISKDITDKTKGKQAAVTWPSGQDSGLVILTFQLQIPPATRWIPEYKLSPTRFVLSQFRFLSSFCLFLTFFSFYFFSVPNCD